MSRILQTPCPAPTSALDPSHRRISSFELFGDDTTTNIDYTRAIDQPLTGIKPRRRSMLMGPARKKTTAAPVTIFEDVSEEQEMYVEGGQDLKVSERAERLGNGSTLLGKPPAKRMPAVVGSGIGRSTGMGGYGMGYSRSERTGTGSGNRGTIGEVRNMTDLHSEGPVGAPYRAVTSNATNLHMTNRHSVALEAAPSTKVGTNNMAGIGSTVRKPPRRQTIFIPEDTTMMSIHPGPRDNTSRIDDSFHLSNLAVSQPQNLRDQCNNGAPHQARSTLGAPAMKNIQRRQSIFVPMPEQSTAHRVQPETTHHSNRIDDSFQLPSLPSPQPKQTQNDTVFAQKPLRKPRQSLLAPPKRLPLRESTSSENMPGWDVAGANTGKENIPPDGHVLVEKGLKCLEISDQAQPRRQSIQPRVRSSLYGPTQASQHRQSVVPRPQVSASSTVSNRARPTVSFQEPLQQSGNSKPAPVSRDDEVKRVREFIANKRVEQQTARLRQYPVLEGALSEPALYEGKWPSYREDALSEVINRIFEATSSVSAMHASTAEFSLMDQLISLYNRPQTTVLHDRIRASLEYGALACPQSSVSEHQPSKDRGLQQQLLDLWLESYDSKLLMAAAQVVTGRQIASTSVDLQSEGHLGRQFFKDFFINTIDVDSLPSSTDVEIDLQRWRKTMLRSVMLVWLLDQAAEARLTNGGCLLKSSSLRKSSAAILQTLGVLMLPACGDIMRALKHLTYEVSYHQNPLDEIVYHVENIAVDFRDGVFLTRLVEVLLYNNNNHNNNKPINPTRPDPNILDDLTLACSTPLPDDDDDNNNKSTLTLHQQPQRPLTQHLKLPANTPVHRTFNIQLALDAFFSHLAISIPLPRKDEEEEDNEIVNNIPAAIATATVEDILHGHREKTLDFLENLVRGFGGLDGLAR